MIASERRIFEMHFARAAALGLSPRAAAGFIRFDNETIAVEERDRSSFEEHAAHLIDAAAAVVVCEFVVYPLRRPVDTGINW